MSFTLGRLANVLATSEFPYLHRAYPSEKTKSERAAKSEQLPNAYSK